MARIGIIRCEKNETRCPLTGCFKSLERGDQGFAVGQGPHELAGVFTCRCPGDNVGELAGILKAKGAERIHLCTCLFAGRENGAWAEGKGLCDQPDALARMAADGAGLPCVLGTAHLPGGYSPAVFT